MSTSTVSGPPYAQTNAALGLTPSIATDVPICAVFIAIYLACAATSGTIFQENRHRDHKFIISWLFAGFCMARVLTCALRVAWATRLDNVSLSIAATILTGLGVFLLYIINIIFAQRILRARRPSLGWHPVLKITLTILYSLIAVVAVLVISFTVLSYYTRDTSLLLAAKDVSLAASTYLMVFTCMPFVFLLAAYWPGTKSATPMETFGKGSVEIKAVVLLALTSLMTLEQGYKYGIAWVPSTYPASNPPWYDSKACFYAFGFMLEVLYLLIALATRVDLVFHVPNGSSKRKTYMVYEEKSGDVESRSASEDIA